MKDVVEKILKEEGKASKILQDAKEEAERVVKEAKREKERLIGQSIIDADGSSHKYKEESEKNFLSEKEKVLKEVKRETQAIREKKEKDIPGISRKVFSRIITIKD